MTGRQGVRTGSGKLHQQMLVSLLFACHATASCCSMSPCYIYNYSKTPRGASVTVNSYFWIFPPTLHAETTQTFRAQILSFAFRIRPQTLRRPAGPAYCTWWSVCSLPVSCLSCLLSKLLPWFKQAPPAFPGPFLSSFHLNFSSGQFLFPFLFRNLAVPLPQSLLPWLPPQWWAVLLNCGPKYSCTLLFLGAFSQPQGSNWYTSWLAPGTKGIHCKQIFRAQSQKDTSTKMCWK